MIPPCPVSLGEQLLVEKVSYAQAYVCAIQHLPEEARYKIYLHWKIQGEYIGNSVVYSSDYKKVWYKLSEFN